MFPNIWMLPSDGSSTVFIKEWTWSLTILRQAIEFKLCLFGLGNISWIHFHPMLQQKLTDHHTIQHFSNLLLFNFGEPVGNCSLQFHILSCQEYDFMWLLLLQPICLDVLCIQKPRTMSRSLSLTFLFHSEFCCERQQVALTISICLSVPSC